MDRNIRTEKLWGVALGSLVVAGAVFGASPASAQEGAAPASADTEARQASSGPQVGEIIVTAQKRSENLQKVPVSVATVTGETLEVAHITGTEDLNQALPGVTVNTALGYIFPFFRGVGQAGAANGVESPVAIYVDGVYMMSPGSGIMSLNSIAQIDVLRGPQGTLFGRNATGGVLQITTKNPSSTATVDADVGYSSYNTVEAHFYGSTPLSDDLGVSLAVAGRDRDKGFAYNATTGTRPFSDESFAIQNKWLWTPGSRTEFLLNLSYDRQKFFSNTGIAPGFIASDGVTRYAGRTLFGRKDSTVNNKQYLASLKATQDFDFATLSNQVAWHSFNNQIYYVQNPIPGNIINPLIPNSTAVVAALEIPVRNKGRTITDELQLQSPDGQDLKWTIGAFFLSDVSKSDQFIEFNEVFFSRTIGRIETVSYAVFAQATKTLITNTRLTLGARYTWDEISFSGTATRGAATPVAGGIPTQVNQSAPSYRVSLDHDFSPDILGFASWNRGFRSGGYTINNFTNPPLKPEKMDSYEVGLKTKLFDNRLRFNVSAFYYDYSDIQLRASNGQGVAQRLNAASGRGKGVDIDFEARVTENLTLTGGAEFLNAKFKDFKRGPCPLDLPTGGVNSNVTCDLSGKRFQYAPKASVTVRAVYRIPLSIGDVTLNASDSYSSGYYGEPDNVVRQPSFHNVSASAGWTSTDKHWGVEVWVRNLLDTELLSHIATTASRIYAPGEPRTVGITFKAHL